MPGSHTSSFLGTPDHIDLGDANHVLLLNNFDMDQFTAEQFQTLNVHHPDSLKTAVPKRQAHFLAGRALVNQAFRHFGHSDQTIVIGGNRAPVWPDGFVGSISHTKNKCACILSQTNTVTVGIDIEQKLNPKSLPAVRKIALNDAERLMIDSQTTMDATHLTGLVFSAKEALYKTLFPVVQRFFGFDHAELCQLPDGGTLGLKLTKDLDQTLGTGATFIVHYRILDAYVLTWLVIDRP